MMDAIKILGSLLNNGHVSRGKGLGVLGKILGGAGSGGSRPQQAPRSHAPANRHGHAQQGTSPLGGLIRAAVQHYGNKHAQQNHRQQDRDHHRHEHDHRQQQQELRQLEIKRHRLEQEARRLQRKHQREEDRHQRDEQRHQQQERAHRHAPVQQRAQRRPHEGCFPDDHDAASFQAQLMIRAMIYAGKSDGCLDQEEQNYILGNLGQLSPQEKQFLQHEFHRNICIRDFAREVPPGLEDEIYAISLASIDLDTNKEARYLHDLCHELELSHEVANYIHAQVGAPPLFT